MNKEREFVAGAVLSIGLAIIPLTGWIYWTLSPSFDAGHQSSAA